MASNFKIFISYRRKGGYDTAKLIYDRLRLDGYSVFFDIDTLENGNFDNELEKRVKKCKDFLLILSLGIFDRFAEPGYEAKDDWVRQEIICALKANKNMVPLVLEEFVYPRRLPNDIKDITRKNSIDLNPRHFEAAYAKLKESFLLSKPRFGVRNKKPIRLFILSIFLIIILLLSIKGFLIYHQKDLEAKEAIVAAQKADSIRIAQAEEKAQEMARMADSIHAAKEEEMMRMADSMHAAIEEEMARVADSIHATATKSSKKSQSTGQTTTAKTASQATTAKTASQTSSKKSLHWSAANDNIGQVLFEKIAPAGVRKAKCSGDGLILSLNKPSCKNTGKVTCSYSPKITVTNCSGKLMSVMSVSETYKSSSQATETAAKKDLANQLSKTNFSSWVSELRKMK